MGEQPLGPGTVLAGRFALEDLLDDTDGARLWRATDRMLARDVSVHVVSDDDPRADALLAAARSSALVGDEHLLRVLDAAREPGAVYVVTEWGLGVALDRMLVEGGPLSGRRAAWVVMEVAAAIAVAHRNGVAHGRLLPENVMLTETGSVKVLGFAVDAALHADEPDARAMSASGGPLPAQRADVVDLGALLYASLVGRWPGTGRSVLPPAPLEHGQPLRPRRVRAGVPRDLDAVCERLLNADGHHPATVPMRSAHEVYAALSDFIGEPGTAPLGEQLARRAAAGPATVAWGVSQDADDEPGEPRDQSGPPHDQRDQPGGPDDDLEETRAGSPVVDAQETVGWTLDAWSAPEDEPTRVHPAARPAPGPAADPSPPPAPEPRAPRPLFADDVPGGGRRAGAGRGRPAGVDPGSGQASAPPGHDHDDHPGRHPEDQDGRHGGDDTGSFLGGLGLGASGGPPRSTGAGNGSVPPRWGPDDGGPGGVGLDEPWAEAPAAAVPGRSWLRLAVLVGVLVVVALVGVLAVGLRRGGSEPVAGDGASGSTSASSSPSASPSGGAPVRIDGVRDFDPEGQPPEENPSLAPLAVDGKPGTAWQTQTYYNNPRLGGLKSGVGLLVDLGRTRTVGEVRLTLLGSPTSLQILAAPGATTAPTSLTGLRRVAADRGAGTTPTLRLDTAVRTRWLVVWLTSLPAAPGGYQGQVAEIRVRS